MTSENKTLLLCVQLPLLTAGVVLLTGGKGSGPGSLTEIEWCMAAPTEL